MAKKRKLEPIGEYIITVYEDGSMHMDGLEKWLSPRHPWAVNVLGIAEEKLHRDSPVIARLKALYQKLLSSGKVIQISASHGVVKKEDIGRWL